MTINSEAIEQHDTSPETAMITVPQNPPAPLNETLVDEAYTTIRDIYTKHATEAHLEIASYLKKTFFNDDIELLEARKPATDREESFNMLSKRLVGADSSLPRKTYLYDSIGLLLDEYALNTEEDKEVFRTYGNLSVSHKIKLLQLKDLKEKQEMIIEIKENEYSVRDLHEKIKALKPKKAKRLKGRGKNLLTALKKVNSYMKKSKDTIDELIASSPDNLAYKKLNQQLSTIIESIDEIRN